MPTQVFDVKEVDFDDEGSFAVKTFTYTKRKNVLGVRFTPNQDRQEDHTLQNRLAHSRPGYLGPRSGSLEIDVAWDGANASTATGALTATNLQKLLGDGLGGSDLTEVGGTVAGGATATSLPYAGATLVRGGIARIGSANDGRGGGQPVVVGTPTATPATLLTAMPGVPNAADVIRAAQLVYPTEVPGTTKRFCVGYPQTGMQYHALGCQLEEVTLKTQIGAEPMMTLKYMVASWQLSTTAIPSALSPESCKSAIIAGGSFFLNTVGTATRATEAVSDFSITISLGLIPIPGLTGDTYQVYGGYARKDVVVKVSFLIPWGTQKLTDYMLDGADTVLKHILIALNTDDTGRAVGAYFPSLFPIGPAPTVENFNGLAFQRVTYQAQEGPDTTNDLTRSSFRLYFS